MYTKLIKTNYMHQLIVVGISIAIKTSVTDSFVPYTWQTLLMGTEGTYFVTGSQCPSLKAQAQVQNLDRELHEVSSLCHRGQESIFKGLLLSNLMLTAQQVRMPRFFETFLRESNRYLEKPMHVEKYSF